MSELLEAIDHEASRLPTSVQQEVLDFIGSLRTKYAQLPNLAWLDHAWGCSPAFLDRPKPPPLDEIQQFPTPTDKSKAGSSGRWLP